MADERPEVATKGPSIPDVSGMSQAEIDRVITEFSGQFPGSAADMLLVATKLNSGTVGMLAALGDRLGRRQQDIVDLQNIVKTALELNRKIARIGVRLLNEEDIDVR